MGLKSKVTNFKHKRLVKKLLDTSSKDDLCYAVTMHRPIGDDALENTTYRGFKIKNETRVMYSRNPIKGLIQESSTLFRIKEYPPTEIIFRIKKIPDPSFNHLLNRSVRQEYPTNLEKEKRKKLILDVFNQIIMLIDNEAEKYLKNEAVED